MSTKISPNLETPVVNMHRSAFDKSFCLKPEIEKNSKCCCKDDDDTDEKCQNTVKGYCSTCNKGYCSTIPEECIIGLHRLVFTNPTFAFDQIVCQGFKKYYTKKGFYAYYSSEDDKIETLLTSEHEWMFVGNNKHHYMITQWSNYHIEGDNVECKTVQSGLMMFNAQSPQDCVLVNRMHGKLSYSLPDGVKDKSQNVINFIINEKIPNVAYMIKKDVEEGDFYFCFTNSFGNEWSDDLNLIDPERQAESYQYSLTMSTMKTFVSYHNGSVFMLCLVDDKICACSCHNDNKSSVNYCVFPFNNISDLHIGILQGGFNILFMLDKFMKVTTCVMPMESYFLTRKLNCTIMESQRMALTSCSLIQTLGPFCIIEIDGVPFVCDARLHKVTDIPIVTYPDQKGIAKPLQKFPVEDIKGKVAIGNIKNDFMKEMNTTVQSSAMNSFHQIHTQMVASSFGNWRMNRYLTMNQDAVKSSTDSAYVFMSEELFRATTAKMCEVTVEMLMECELNPKQKEIIEFIMFESFNRQTTNDVPDQASVAGWALALCERYNRRIGNIASKFIDNMQDTRQKLETDFQKEKDEHLKTINEKDKQIKKREKVISALEKQIQEIRQERKDLSKEKKTWSREKKQLQRELERSSLSPVNEQEQETNQVAMKLKMENQELRSKIISLEKMVEEKTKNEEILWSRLEENKRIAAIKTKENENWMQNVAREMRQTSADFKASQQHIFVLKQNNATARQKFLQNERHNLSLMKQRITKISSFVDQEATMINSMKSVITEFIEEKKKLFHSNRIQNAKINELKKELQLLQKSTMDDSEVNGNASRAAINHPMNYVLTLMPTTQWLMP
jgi:hypothetical protein